MTLLLLVLALLVSFSVSGLILLAITLGKVHFGNKSREEKGKTFREEIHQNREENAKHARSLREEVVSSQKQANETLINTVTKVVGEMNQAQQTLLHSVEERIKNLNHQNEIKADDLRKTLDLKMQNLQESNDKKLDQMRQTVDEKLQNTLEKRLGESFNMVSERLEKVHRDLGEIQSLAIGIGDLKRILSNVKTRGTWGEIQLGAILEQILTPEQYGKNVQVCPSSKEVVEFAVRLPGGSKDPSDAPLWLPIDSKFPQEDYQRLLNVMETGNTGTRTNTGTGTDKDTGAGAGGTGADTGTGAGAGAGTGVGAGTGASTDTETIQQFAKAFIRSIETSAKNISEKYIKPPATTDFAILFCPTEGLYAEILKQPGFVEKLQQQYRIVPAGPTTLSALLNSLRMGFRTLAIEKRSSEVWQILSAVKTEFGKFGDVLARLKRQLNAATHTIETSEARTRVMSKKLHAVEKLPEEKSLKLLNLSEPTEAETEAETKKETEVESEKIAKTEAEAEAKMELETEVASGMNRSEKENHPQP